MSIRDNAHVSAFLSSVTNELLRKHARALHFRVFARTQRSNCKGNFHKGGFLWDCRTSGCPYCWRHPQECMPPTLAFLSVSKLLLANLTKDFKAVNLLLEQNHQSRNTTMARCWQVQVKKRLRETWPRDLSGAMQLSESPRLWAAESPNLPPSPFLCLGFPV